MEKSDLQVEDVYKRQEQGFLLHRQTGVDLAEDRAVLAAVEEDAALDGVLPIHYIVPVSYTHLFE